MVNKNCYFCANKADMDDTETLKRFLDPQAKIFPRRKTAVCLKHQRKLARAVKRARILSRLPFVSR